MRLSVRLTLDGLVRALRTKAHAMADGLETGYDRDLIVANTLQADSRDPRPARTRLRGTGYDGVGGD